MRLACRGAVVAPGLAVSPAKVDVLFDSNGLLLTHSMNVIAGATQPIILAEHYVLLKVLFIIRCNFRIVHLVFELKLQ